MIGIIDYGAGNIRSVGNALDRLEAQYFVSNDINELRRAEKLILPGVGEARSAMESLDRVGLINWLRTIEIPFLGICIGMQILFEHSSERETTCLGVVPGTVSKFDAAVCKVPHIGWNQIRITRNDPLFQGIRDGEFVYFVHSYRAPVIETAVALTEYGGTFSAAIRKDNYCGVQFHIEKSGKAGLQILKNFIELC